MCCFSRPVQLVSATNIFARSAENGRQYLAYSMSINAKEELAMVLPLPVKAGSGEKAVEFIDLSGYKEFFADMRSGFLHFLPNSRSGPQPGAATARTLEVVSVGSFEASFVPTVADFARLDERFRLPAGTWNALPAYRSWGFAVFKLKPGESKVHPMSFSFPRAKPSELFFPTVHIHDGQVHDRARFDHALYCQRGAGDEFSLMDWEESTRHAASFTQPDKARGLIDAHAHCYRKELNGRLANKDTVLSAG